VAVGASASEPTTTLAAVSWETVTDLAALSEGGRTLRYVAPGVALVTAADAATIAEAGRALLFVDTAPVGSGYFLSDHLHDGPLPDHVHLVYRSPDGWALMRLPWARLVETLDDEHFLYPLPERYVAPLPAPTPRLTAREPSGQVQALIDQVQASRLRDVVERLVFFDPAAGAVTDNVRTRYARRPETFASTLYLRDELAAVLGAGAVELDSFRIAPDDSLMYNVVAELPGTDPEAGYWVVCAHYDAIGTRTRRADMVRIGEESALWQWPVHPAPGADDNGSGVAVVIETARVLAQQEFPFSIRFIAWSGEELGLWGSRHYTARARARKDHVVGVLNFDMVGFNDLADRLELVSNPASTWLVDLMQQTADRYQIGLQIDVLVDRFAGLSDHQPFWSQGYDAILGIENYLPTDSLSAGVMQGDYRINSQYHSVSDLPDSINWELVARVTRLTVATLSQFGTEEGLPNLAVFGGDLRGDEAGDLQVQIANLGPVDAHGDFGLRVSRCAADSTACQVIFETVHSGPVATGSAVAITVPWQRYGDNVFLVEVDPADEIVEEVETVDNRAFISVRLTPSEDVAVFPNPYRPSGGFLRFSGVPLFSRVRLYRLGGEFVWLGREEDQGNLTREIRWTGTNEGGFTVSSGIYVYELRAFEGEVLERGKIAVVR
jgi:hypothetical protein